MRWSFKMFKSSRRSSKGKSRANPLLNLALQDAEWISTNNDYLEVNHDNKTIVVPQRATSLRTDKYYKVNKLIAYVDAKYNKPRKYVGVKHLQPLYIKTAENYTVYWYAEKKGLEKIGYSNESIKPYLNSLPSLSRGYINDVLHRVINSIYSNTFDPILFLHEFSKMPLLVQGDLYSIYTGVYNTLSNIKGPEIADSDTSNIKSALIEMGTILRKAFNMTMSTRKDSKSVPNSKIKSVAQYIYDECEKLRVKYTADTMPSVAIKNIGDYDFDTQGILDDDDMEDLDNTVKSELRESASDATAFWGKMAIRTPKLTRSLPAELMGKSKRKKDIGVRPNAMHRYATDKKIFIDKAKRISGTVLIDASGSMHFDDDDIEALVRMLPASTVAIYSGVNYPGDGYKKDDVLGHLQIIAQNGKWVEEIPIHDQNNIIDGPAIDWLCKQAEPRILVSDLAFTGVTEGKDGTLYVQRAKHLFIDALAKMNKFKVIPLMDIEKAKEWVEAYKK